MWVAAHIHDHVAHCLCAHWLARLLRTLYVARHTGCTHFGFIYPTVARCSTGYVPLHHAPRFASARMAQPAASLQPPQHGLLTAALGSTLLDCHTRLKLPPALHCSCWDRHSEACGGLTPLVLLAAEATRGPVQAAKALALTHILHSHLHLHTLDTLLWLCWPLTSPALHLFVDQGFFFFFILNTPYTYYTVPYFCAFFLCTLHLLCTFGTHNLTFVITLLAYISTVTRTFYTHTDTLHTFPFAHTVHACAPRRRTARWQQQLPCFPVLPALLCHCPGCAGPQRAAFAYATRAYTDHAL